MIMLHESERQSVLSVRFPYKLLVVLLMQVDNTKTLLCIQKKTINNKLGVTT